MNKDNIYAQAPCVAQKVKSTTAQWCPVSQEEHGLVVLGLIANHFIVDSLITFLLVHLVMLFPVCNFQNIFQCSFIE